METSISLSRLHADIEVRVQAIRAGHRQWPCTKGCAGCCRHLADVPQLTEAEWRLLLEGLATLPAERLGQIGRDLAALDNRRQRPVVCPLLDRSTNACPVYAQRPVACRSYGFYVQRDHGLYCSDIEAQVTAGVLADVVWGNHDAIDRHLASLGGARPLTEWFARWQDGKQAAARQQSASLRTTSSDKESLSRRCRRALAPAPQGGFGCCRAHGRMRVRVSARFRDPS